MCLVEVARLWGDVPLFLFFFGGVKTLEKFRTVFLKVE